MEITLYSFSKRINSTKQPTGGTTATVVLKEDTSIYTPSFILTGNLPSYNYLKWGGRYYFIEDIVSINRNTYEIMCNLDVLATYKSDILNTKAFVLYSTNVYNSGIPDTRLSTTRDAIINTSSANILPVTDGNTGFYAITYITESGNSPIGEALVSKGRYSGMLIHNILQSTDFANFIDTTKKLLSDCASALRSCTFIPLSSVSGASTTIKISNYDTHTVPGYETGTETYTAIVSIPWNFSDFRNRSQYTSLSLYLPAYGWLDLNADDYNGKSSINVKAEVDTLTGATSYMIDNVARCSTSIGKPVAVGVSTSGMLNGISSVMGAVGGAVSGNILGAVSNTFNACTSVLSRSVGSIGSNGSLVGLNGGNLKAVCISHNTSETPADMANTLGRPYNNVTTLSNISGYCECANASVNSTAPGNIKDQINSYLNGGVYIE